MKDPERRYLNRHDNPAPDIHAARRRAPRAWKLLDEMDALFFTGNAVSGISIGEIERLVIALSLCGHGSHGDISEETAASIRERLSRVNQ